MEEKIIGLVDLQRTDLRVWVLEEFLAGLPGLRDELASERAAAEAAIQAERDKLDNARRSLKKKETELADGEEKHRQIQGKLNQVKTNKEYEAALKEIEERLHKNGDIESAILMLYDEVETAEAARADLEADWKELAEEFEARKKELEGRAASAERELADRSRERAEHFEVLDREIRDRYELLRTKYRQVVARADKEICQGCHTYIPPQTYNLVLRGDQMIPCPACQRLLVPVECRLGEDDVVIEP